MNFTLNGRLLKYVNEECILIYCNTGNWRINPIWKEISHFIDIDNYKIINIGNKKYRLHRILGYLFLGLNIEDKTQEIDHINRNRLDNRLENLRIVSHHQNQWNRTKTKPKKMYNKYLSRITINKKEIYLGLFDTEEEAKQAYLDAKQVYHLIE